MPIQINRDKCHYCGEDKKRLVKYSNGTQTQTYIYVCENKECPLKINIEKLKTWAKQ